jgi:polyferredoxin
MKSAKRRWPRPLQWFRYGVQAIIAAYVLVLVIANSSGQRWAANQHTVCPFGGVVNLFTYSSGGGYVAKLHSAVFIMLIALLIGLVLTGKSFCGWICPLGSIQQGLGWIGQHLWPRAYNKVPRWLERILQYLKWAVLAWVLVQTARSTTLVFQDWDPYYNLYRIWTDEVAISGYVVTGLTVLLALFIPRPFSRYACPLGAFNGIFNSFSFISIKRDAQTCNDCGRCSKVCPVNIDLCASATIRNIECTRCLKCIDVCPQNSGAGDTLKLHTWFSGLKNPWRGTAAVESVAPDAAAATSPQKRRSVSTWVFAGVAVLAFVLPILITNLSGDFRITGGRGGGGGQGQESVEPSAGTSLDGQTIRGSSTLADVQALGVDMTAFFQEFGLPAGTSLDTRLRDLTEVYGFEIAEVRTYVENVGQ